MVRDDGRPSLVAVGWTVTLLGGFGLRDGGGVVELPTDAQRVVAFLALQHQRVPRAYVAGSLWLD
ncbi:MAG TPA: hypothetical protein VGC11_06595, partial [Acidimicrobiia bacterium]